MWCGHFHLKTTVSYKDLNSRSILHRRVCKLISLWPCGFTDISGSSFLIRHFFFAISSSGHFFFDMKFSKHFLNSRTSIKIASFRATLKGEEEVSRGRNDRAQPLSTSHHVFVIQSSSLFIAIEFYLHEQIYKPKFNLDKYFHKILFFIAFSKCSRDWIVAQFLWICAQSVNKQKTFRQQQIQTNNNERNVIYRKGQSEEYKKENQSSWKFVLHVKQ